MKHVYAFLFILLGLAMVGMALLCPLVKGLLAIITFIIGGAFLNYGGQVAGLHKKPDEPF